MERYKASCSSFTLTYGLENFNFSEKNIFKIAGLASSFPINVARTQFLTHQSRRLQESLNDRQALSSVYCPSTISSDFFPETIGLIVTKFHIQPSGPIEKKVVQMVWVA